MLFFFDHSTTMDYFEKDWGKNVISFFKLKILVLVVLASDQTLIKWVCRHAEMVLTSWCWKGLASPHPQSYCRPWQMIFVQAVPALRGESQTGTNRTAVRELRVQELVVSNISLFPLCLCLYTSQSLYLDKASIKHRLIHHALSRLLVRNHSVFFLLNFLHRHPILDRKTNA